MLIYFILIWFSDKLLFTLTTRKNSESGVWSANSKALEHKRLFSRKNDAQSIVNGDRRRVEIELYARVMFVDSGVQIDEN